MKPRAAFPATLAVWALFASGAALLPADTLAWQGSLAAPWRLWTSTFAHWTPWHLQMNLAGCAVLALLGWRAQLGPRDAVAAWIALALTPLGLLLRPDLGAYAGLSGALHAATAVIACALIRRAGRERVVGLGIALGLALKIAAEQPWGSALQTVDGLDFPLAPWAHLSGAVAGLLASGLGPRAAQMTLSSSSGRPSRRR
jgi:rhomboid family GlyGly-CTERM serine protease